MSLIVVEGIDAAGKTTVSKELGRRLDCPVKASGIQDFLLETKKVVDSSPERYLMPRLVYYLAMNQLVVNSSIDEIKKGPLILDRYIYSTQAAHNTFDELWCKGVHKEEIKILINAAKKDLAVPDAVIFLSVNSEQRQKRLLRRGSSKNNRLDLDEEIAWRTEEKFKGIANALTEEGRIKVAWIDTSGQDVDAVVGMSLQFVRSSQLRLTYMPV